MLYCPAWTTNGKRSEGLTNIGVSSSCHSQSGCPWGGSRLVAVGTAANFGSSSRLLPDFIHLSPYLEMEVAHAAGWHVVPASWERSKTTRWPQLSVPDFRITLFHFGSISGVATVAYTFTGDKKITSSTRWNWIHIHLPVLEKNSYRISPCQGKKKKQGKVSFWSSPLTEAFWSWYCWFLKDLLVSWRPKHESVL